MKRLSLKKVLSFVFICLFVFSICAVGIKGVQAEDEDPLVTLFNVKEIHSLSEWIKSLSYGQIKTPVLQ